MSKLLGHKQNKQKRIWLRQQGTWKRGEWGQLFGCNIWTFFVFGNFVSYHIDKLLWLEDYVETYNVSNQIAT